MNDLIEARAPICLLCARPLVDERGMCDVCAPLLPVERGLLFGERSGVLEALINEFKFGRKRVAYRPIALLLRSILPYRLTDAVVVPVPTITKHVRLRGYDHMSLITHRVSRLIGARAMPLLYRTGSRVQHGADRSTRIKQASAAFHARRPLDPELTYVLVDDIVTTGSSLKYAAQALRDAGAERIWLLALARQPLDGQG